MWMSTRELSRKLVSEVVAQGSFAVWKSSDFRKLVDFNKISNKKQDKIFNELEITALCYVLFFLEERIKKNENNINFAVYVNTRELVVGEFISLMSKTGVGGSGIRMWNVFVEKRFKEYEKDIELVMEKSSNWDVFKGKDKFLRPTWSRIITISINSLKNIRENDDTPLEDPLWQYIRHWLIGLEVELIKFFKDTDFKDLYVLN